MNQIVWNRSADSIAKSNLSVLIIYRNPDLIDDILEQSELETTRYSWKFNFEKCDTPAHNPSVCCPVLAEAKTSEQ